MKFLTWFVPITVAGTGIFALIGIVLAVVQIIFAIYGLVLCFSASWLTGLISLFIPYSCIIEGLVKFFAHKDLALMLAHWLNLSI